MTSPPQTARDRPPWWRPVLNDPVLLIACAVLATLALAAAALTAVDRTAARAEAAARVAAAARAEKVARTAATVPPPLSGGEPPDRGPGAHQRSPGRSPSVDAALCPRSGAVVRAGGFDAAMGLRTMGLELVNCGRRPLTVRGFPEVRVLGPARTPLPVEIIEGPSAITVLPPVDDPPARVKLEPGERATAVLVWRTTAIAGPADRVTHIEVTARPGEEAQTVTPARELDIGTGGRLAVGPWREDPGD